ncbi:MAG: TrbG/VirB9 family P-type conjugative transfer protein [Rickettsiales bacterium]
MRYAVALLALLLISAPIMPAHAQPIVSDSRIKTFVYNENEVFNVTTHYGYQANVEFGNKEEIETVSVGDRVGWQIVPAGRRLFIRAMEEKAHTNMTIVTNKRAYQFDLRSSESDAVYGSEELTYVVRFFYPEEGGLPPSPISIPTQQTSAWASPAAPVQQVMSAPMAPPVSMPMPAPAPQIMSAPVQTYAPPPAAPTATAYSNLPSPALLTRAPTPAAPVATTIASPQASTSSMNYRYTYTGPNEIAPVKIYDDGRSTYFKFRDMSRLPRLAIINSRGEEIEVPYQLNAEGLAVVNAIAPRFSLRNNGAEVMVYNEAQVSG